jgi:aspartate aminotransferase
VQGAFIGNKDIQKQAVGAVFVECPIRYLRQKFSARALLRSTHYQALEFHRAVLRLQASQNGEAADLSLLILGYDVGRVGVGEHFLVLVFRPVAHHGAKLREPLQGTNLRDIGLRRTSESHARKITLPFKIEREASLLHASGLPATTTEEAIEPRFSSSLIRAVANTAMGREDVLPFWFGESDQPTPEFIRQAAIASLRDGETFYSENLGRLYLRQAISAYLTGLHHRPIHTDRIAVTGSGVSALMLASQLLVTPGDRVVTVTPLWPNAVEIPKVVHGQVSCISLEVRNGRWTLPLEKLLHALTPGTRMLVLNSPNNPTGWTIQRAEQVAIFEHCRRHGIWILADDVYERLISVDGVRSAPSFLTLAGDDDRLISTNSFSKAWTMTGWRVGWMVVPAAIQDDLGSLVEYNTSCVSEFSQRAAAIALQQGEASVARLRAELAQTKARLSEALRGLPRLEVPASDGLMYLFLRVAGEENSVSLAKRLIEEVGLGLAPGRAFGPEGEGWLRWCYAAEWKKIESGIERLTRFLSR